MTHFARYSLTTATARLIANAWRAMVNRKQVAKLSDLTDAQLADIGLTRSDVRRALQRSLFADPSPVLTAMARGREQHFSSIVPEVVLPARSQAANTISSPAPYPVRKLAA